MTQTKIEKLIVDSGYLQKFICKKTNIAESTLCRYKKGLRMSERDADSLAAFFSVGRDEIVGYVEDVRRCANKLQNVAM